jgi:hypothetical protein
VSHKGSLWFFSHFRGARTHSIRLPAHPRSTIPMFVRCLESLPAPSLGRASHRNLDFTALDIGSDLDQLPPDRCCPKFFATRGLLSLAMPERLGLNVVATGELRARGVCSNKE